MINAEEKLRTFQTENNIVTKGPLSVVIQFTRMVKGKATDGLRSSAALLFVYRSLGGTYGSLPSSRRQNLSRM